MSKIVWEINQFNWEQDTPYLWSAGCFWSSLWVDIRKEPPFIKLSTELKLEWTFDADITYMKDLQDFWLTWVVVCLTNWKIYLDWTLKHTIVSTSLTTSKKVIWIWYMWNVSWSEYLYYFTDLAYNTWSIHRSDIAITTATFTEDFRDYNTWWNWLNNDEIHIISEEDRMIIWVRDRVFQFDELEPTTLTTLLEFTKWEEIIWITEYDNNYRVYVSLKSWTWFGSWKVYYWDWVSSNIDRVEFWNNLPFQWVVNNWAYDFIITWISNFYTDLYRNPWKQAIRVNLEWESSTSSTWKRNFSKYITVRWDILYISWKNKEWINCIYSLGSYFPWFTDSLVAEYYIPSWTNAFLFHTHWQEKSYFACTDDKVYSTWFSNDFSVLKYVPSATIITKKWTWNWIHTLKSIDYMYIGYKLETWTSILIYADKWTWYKLLKTIAITTETPITQKWIRIEANEFQSLDLWDFYELELKFVLATTDTTKSPALWPVLLFCNDNYNK